MFGIYLTHCNHTIFVSAPRSCVLCVCKSVFHVLRILRKWIFGGCIITLVNKIRGIKFSRLTAILYERDYSRFKFSCFRACVKINSTRNNQLHPSATRQRSTGAKQQWIVYNSSAGAGSHRTPRPRNDPWSFWYHIIWRLLPLIKV